MLIVAIVIAVVFLCWSSISTAMSKIQFDQDGLRIYEGDWIVKYGTDPFDDEKFFTAKLFNPNTNKKFKTQDDSSIVIHYSDNLLIFAYFPNGLRLKATQKIQVKYRIDSNVSEVSTWDVESDGRAVMLMGLATDDFIKKLYNAQKLVLQVSDKKGYLFTDIFQLKGINKQIDRVRGAVKANSKK